MSYVYINLRADTEEDAKNAAIAASELPEGKQFKLLMEDENGDLQWNTNSEKHAFFPSGPRMITPGEYEEDGTEITPPEIDNRFHAILAVRSDMEQDVRQILTEVGLAYPIDMDVEVDFQIMGTNT